MAVSREKKYSLLEIYEQAMVDAPHVFLLGFSGIKVDQVTELREQIRQQGGHYVVVKNRVIRRAVKGRPLGQLSEHFSGPTAVAYSTGDPVAIAKVLTAFAKTAPVLEFKAGLVESRPIAASQVQEIALLPSRDELIAKLLNVLQSPISRFVRVLGAAGPQRLATVIDQIAQKRA